MNVQLRLTYKSHFRSVLLSPLICPRPFESALVALFASIAVINRGEITRPQSHKDSPSHSRIQCKSPLTDCFLPPWWHHYELSRGDPQGTISFHDVQHFLHCQVYWDLLWSVSQGILFPSFQVVSCSWFSKGRLFWSSWLHWILSCIGTWWDQICSVCSVCIIDPWHQAGGVHFAWRTRLSWWV